MKILKYINAAAFFRDYLPHIKSVKFKMRGKNSKGNPVDFTKEEKTEIIKALRKMLSDLKVW